LTSAAIVKTTQAAGINPPAAGVGGTGGTLTSAAIVKTTQAAGAAPGKFPEQSLIDQSLT
jgi:hypothetical protein